MAGAGVIVGGAVAAPAFAVIGLGIGVAQLAFGHYFDSNFSIKLFNK